MASKYNRGAALLSWHAKCAYTPLKHYNEHKVLMLLKARSHVDH